MTTLTAEQWPKVMLDQSNKCLADILDAVDVEMSKHYPAAIKTERYYKRVQPKLEEAREAIEEAYGLFGEDWPRYGVPATTIKSACAGQKGNSPAFTEYECRKSGKTWLVTKAGMDRLYGGPKDGKD